MFFLEIVILNLILYFMFTSFFWFNYVLGFFIWLLVCGWQLIYVGFEFQFLLICILELSFLLIALYCGCFNFLFLKKKINFFFFFFFFLLLFYLLYFYFWNGLIKNIIFIWINYYLFYFFNSFDLLIFLLTYSYYFLYLIIILFIFFFFINFFLLIFNSYKFIILKNFNSYNSHIYFNSKKW